MEFVVAGGASGARGLLLKLQSRRRNWETPSGWALAPVDELRRRVEEMVRLRDRLASLIHVHLMKRTLWCPGLCEAGTHSLMVRFLLPKVVLRKVQQHRRLGFPLRGRLWPF
jgi:hypothetical protein